ncbi:MAG: VCBS repeat-containing protein, partial [Bacteroidota bacterium]
GFGPVNSFFYEAPSFLDSTEAIFGGSTPPGISNGDLAWADVDLDQDLDLVVIGFDGSSVVGGVYRNNNGNLNFQASGLSGLQAANLSLADIDGNQTLDLIVVGENGGGNPQTRLYRNTGGTYTLLNSGLPALREGDAAFGDYDQDGDADLVLIGESGGNEFIGLYVNDGDGNFTAAPHSLQAVQNGHVSWQDFDQDQLLDLLVLGEFNGNPVLRLYRNLGYGEFEEVFRPGGSGLVDLSDSDADWADYNSDGFPDLVITGRNQTQLQTRVLRNEAGTGNFTNVSSLLPIERGAARWGDFDDDGVYDLVYVGEGASGPLAKIYRFVSGAFQEQLIGQLPLSAGADASLAFGDCNSDGKLDLALMGEGNSGRFLQVLRNVDSTLNQIPDLPSNLQADVSADTVILSWQVPAGSSGQSFNVYAGTASNQANILPGLSNLNTGFRRVVQLGNAGGDGELRLIGLAGGNIAWGVQAIGQDFEASDWVQGGNFTYQRPDFVNYNVSVFPHTHLGPAERYSRYN